MNEIEEIVKKSNNWKELESNLGLKNNSDRTNLKKIIKEKEISISHFIKNIKIKGKYSNEELFTSNSNINRNIVRRRIIKNNLIPYICECCGQDENWQGKIMPLILDHKNGINNDNRLSNLRFLCSNCDSIQDTYKSKNRSKKKNKPISKTLENNNTKELIINEIINSGINFQERGWRIKLSKKYGWSPQYSGTFIKNNIPKLWKNSQKNLK